MKPHTCASPYAFALRICLWANKELAAAAAKYLLEAFITREVRALKFWLLLFHQTAGCRIWRGPKNELQTLRPDQQQTRDPKK